MSDSVEEALSKLLNYMEQASTVDLAMLSPVTGNASAPAKESLTQALFSVMGVRNGAKTALQIAEELKQRKSNLSPADQAEIDRKFKIYIGSDNPLQPENIMAPIVKDAKGLSIIQLDTVRVTPAGRDVGAVTAFLNMIPSIELSRCVPYLTIDVQTGRPPLTPDNRVQGLSLARFLEGGFDASNPNGDKRLLLSLQGRAQALDELGEFKTDSSGKPGFDVTISGMELFTSPQTLVNPTATANPAALAVDKFRPFMSIDRLNIEITPQVGFFAYRSADLDITLHDRSRLSEIADFIRADLYGTTELLIEYGWSHPDRSGTNVFGDLLNSMRAREKYGIVNSSFSLTKSGEVKIKLKLFTRGMSDIRTVRIGDKGLTLDAARAVRELQKALAGIRAKLGLTSEGVNKEIRGEQHLFANSEDIGTSLVLSGDSQNTVNRFINKTSKNSPVDIQNLATALKELYGNNGKGAQKTQDNNATISKAINASLDGFKVKSGKAIVDPFLVTRDKKLSTLSKDLQIPTDRYVSMARLMATFVGAPMVTGEERYADVQLIFYPFNASAGACANYNIAEFPINIDELKIGFQAIARTRGMQLTLSDFLQYIFNNFVDDMSNRAYGLQNFYTTEIDKKTGVRTPPSNNKKIEATKMRSAVEARLLTIGSKDGMFKPPQLDVIIETVPMDVTAAGPSRKIEKLKTILKIHFFDRCSTAYETLSALILASREDDLRTIGEMANNTASDHAVVSSEQLAAAQKAQVTTKKPAKTAPKNEPSAKDKAADVKNKIAKLGASVAEPENVYEVTFDIEKLRSFLRSSMPTLVYGSNNTGIKEASFSTMQNALLSTVHMLRAGENGPLSPSGLTKANLPLRTIPAKVSMTTVGCPHISYMQQFFIDFNTNTTLDNIYGVNKLSHEISPGKFESKIDFVPLDAYGRYESLTSQVGTMLKQLDSIQNSTKK